MVTCLVQIVKEHAFHWNLKNVYGLKHGVVIFNFMKNSKEVKCNFIMLSILQQYNKSY